MIIKKKFLTHILIFLYVFTISWVDTFSLGDWFPLHVLIGSAIFFIFFIKTLLRNGKINFNVINVDDLFLLIAIFGMLTSSLFNSNIKSINYIMAYLYVFLIGYLSLKIIFFQTISFKSLLRFNFLGVLFVSIFSVIEFFLELFFKINIQTLLPRHKEAKAVYMGISRSYAFSPEPGVVAFYFTTLAPIAVWYLWSFSRIKKINKVLLSLIMLSGWLSTFSAAGLVFLPLSFFISTFIILFLNKKNITISKNRLMYIWILIIIIFILFYFNIDVISYYFRGIYDKVTFRNISSGQDRLSRWVYGLNNIKDNLLFGTGLGNTSVQGRGSTTNWYMFLTLEGGIISSFPIFIFLLLSFIRIFKSNIKGKIFFLTGFIGGTMHFLVISTFQHSFLWLLLIIFSVYNEEIIYKIESN
ncbi:hypothetical protein [Halanaerobium kushneri]|uniref:O-antigen ligase-related domain-containing protein n=1 Tax=Halanaerobium kushneri TaxID=56779 RepID=A0A1N7B602_9FIRM|nr:hypothetical protein [Halanaerobium kushneri]SIR46716.1 hypothetical protein SAMN05421834_12831 [Halanaerobium kushneri]